MKQRIFIGIFLSKKLQKEIAAWQKKHAYLPVRFIKAENLHLTLVPPWYEKNIRKIFDLIKLEQEKIKPFSVHFEKVSFGPILHNPRLIWAVGDAPAQFKKLKSSLAKLLKQKKEKRDLLLHLTIARFKKGQFKKLPVKKLAEKINWVEEINSFHLIKSHLEKSGARYEKIEEH